MRQSWEEKIAGSNIISQDIHCISKLHESQEKILNVNVRDEIRREVAKKDSYFLWWLFNELVSYNERVVCEALASTRVQNVTAFTGRKNNVVKSTRKTMKSLKFSRVSKSSRIL